MSKRAWINSLLLAGVFWTCIWLCVGCVGPNGQKTAGVVASVTVGDPAKRPTVLARYDGVTLVAWGSETYLAEVYIQATGLPLLLKTGSAGRAIVSVSKPKFTWEGAATDPLPEEARSMFRESEIAAWGLEFGFPPVRTGHP